MKHVVPVAVAVCVLVSPVILAASPSSGPAAVTDNGNSIIQISWGQMQAEMAEQEVTATEHGGGNAQMTVSYEPYFFQYFPVWVEVSVVQSPSWLTVSPSQTQFPLQKGETQTDNIVFALTDDVETGAVGLVDIEVEGQTTVLPSLLAINEARASFIVEVA